VVLLLQDKEGLDEGLILKKTSGEILQLIQVISDKTICEAFQNPIYRIPSLYRGEVSFIWLQYEQPYSPEMNYSFIIENLVKIAKSKDKMEDDLVKQLVDPSYYPTIVKKHQLMQEDQARYSIFKFSELLKLASRYKNLLYSAHYFEPR